MSVEEVKAATSAPNNGSEDNVAKSFKMMDPTQLKALLTRGLGPKIQSVM